MSSEKLGAALIGFGRMGRLRFDDLSTLFDWNITIHYIVDKFPAIVQPVVDERYGQSRQAPQVLPIDQIATVWQDKSVNAVFVTVPTEIHKDVILAALNSGKHVFVEKPVALTYEDTKECYDAAEQNSLILYCAFNRRFDPAYAKVNAAVKSESLGGIQLANVFVADHPEPQLTVLTGLGSIFADLAIHGIDILNWLLDDQPVTVSAFAHASKPEYQQAKTHDTCSVSLMYGNGVIAGISSCRYAPYGYDTRLEPTGVVEQLETPVLIRLGPEKVNCEKQNLQYNSNSQIYACYLYLPFMVIGNKSAVVAEGERPDCVILRGPTGDLASMLSYSFPERFKLSFQNEIRHFVNVVKGAEPLSVTKTQVLNVMRVVAAAEEACHTKTVVKV